MSPALQIDDLAVRFGTLRAVDGVNLAAERGTVTALVGPNGAGKTTTVETCEGFRRPASGSVRVLGLDPVSQARQLHPRIGVMLQEGGVPSGARAKDALTHMSRLYANPQDPAALLDLLGLTGVRASYRRMSGGEQQRLKFAIALVGRPELVFLDEPTAGLDAHAKRTVWDVVEQLRANGVTVILTTHLMDEVERLADQVAVIHQGRIIAAGSPAELTAAETPTVAFEAAAGLDLAGLRSVLPAASVVAEIGPGSYRIVGGTGAGTLAVVTGWCADHNVELRAINTGQRRLEDVFLELTDEGSESR